jgi:hypothetical protein
MRLIIESGADCRCENLLTSNEVIAIIPDEYIDLVLMVCEAGRDCSQIHMVNVIHAVYMPLHYVLLFLYGDPGWHYGL